MVVFFRALVMLLTLVGLPAAWIYYGPLPQGAQRVVDRFVEVARDAVGWRQPVMTDTVRGDMKTAPRFDDVLPTENELPAVSRATFQGTSAPVRLASASETLPSTSGPVDVGQDLNSQIEPHLALLQKLGVANYSLERWGEGYRFKCAIPLGDNVDFTRQFEAINVDPLATVRQVVGEVTSWQNARHDATGSPTVWRELRPGSQIMLQRSGNLGRRLASTALRYRSPLVGNEAVNSKSFWLNRAGSSATPQLGNPAEEQEAKIARLEAVLFLSREPISTRKLANVAKLADGTEARTLLKLLARRYEERASAMQVVEVAGGVQLFTRPAVADWIRRLHGESEEIRLSPPAMETLAVVAYRQPVVRAEIEAIRGVQCGEILRVLMERDLLRIVGRSEELGRPFLYGTTKKFLQVFGLRRLEQLPPIDQIHSVGIEW